MLSTKQANHFPYNALYTSVLESLFYIFSTLFIFSFPLHTLITLLLLFTLCDPMDCSTPRFPVLHHLPEFAKYMSNEMVILSNYGILCRRLIILPSVFPSIRVFSSESAVQIRWLKFWSVSFSINSSNEYSRLISFRMDWFDLLAVQGTEKSLLQHLSLKAWIVQCSAFFMVNSHVHT